MKFCWPKAKAKKHKAKKLHSRGSLAQQTHGNGQRGKNRQEEREENKEERERLGTVGEREGERESGTPGLRRAKLKGQTSWHSQLALLPMDGRRTGQGGGSKRPKQSWATLGCPKAKLQPNIFKWRLQHRQNYATNLWEDINFAMFVLATQPNTHTHTPSMSLFLMQEEKQTQISKANKKPVTPYSPSLPPSLPLLELGFGFEFGLGWVWFLASSWWMSCGEICAVQKAAT